jgi:hypothetical protein
MNTTPELSPDRAAWFAGLSYATLFVLAIFANFAVRERLIDLDDAAETAANLADNEALVRIAMLAFVIIFVLDVAIAWLLHLVVRGTGERRSLLAAWFRIGYTVFLGVALVFLFIALRVVDAEGPIGSIADGDRADMALLAADAFNATWMIGLALFGFHLIVLARIFWTSLLAPRWLAVVVGLAGSVYVIDTIGYTVLTDYDSVAPVFTAIVVGPAVVGEAAFTIWLLRRGRGSSVAAGAARAATAT